MELDHLDGTQDDLHALYTSHTQPEGMMHRSDTTEATRDYRKSNDCTLSDSR